LIQHPPSEVAAVKYQSNIQPAVILTTILFLPFNLKHLCKMKYFNEGLNVRKLHNKQIHQTKDQHSIYMEA